MKKSHVFRLGSFLLFFAILCTVCVQRARADETPVDLFTGTFYISPPMFGGQIAGVEDGRVFQSFIGVEVHFAPGVSGLLDTNPGISNFSYDQGVH